MKPKTETRTDLTCYRLEQFGIISEPDTWCGNAGHSIGTRGGQFVTAGEVITELMDERDRLKAIEEAAQHTLNENGHLADGKVCTLRELRDALSLTPSQARIEAERKEAALKDLENAATDIVLLVEGYATIFQCIETRGEIGRFKLLKKALANLAAIRGGGK